MGTEMQESPAENAPPNAQENEGEEKSPVDYSSQSNSSFNEQYSSSMSSSCPASSLVDAFADHIAALDHDDQALMSDLHSQFELQDLDPSSFAPSARFFDSTNLSQFQSLDVNDGIPAYNIFDCDAPLPYIATSDLPTTQTLPDQATHLSSSPSSSTPLPSHKLSSYASFTKFPGQVFVERKPLDSMTSSNATRAILLTPPSLGANQPITSSSPPSSLTETLSQLPFLANITEEVNAMETLEPLFPSLCPYADLIISTNPDTHTSFYGHGVAIPSIPTSLSSTPLYPSETRSSMSATLNLPCLPSFTDPMDITFDWLYSIFDNHQN